MPFTISHAAAVLPLVRRDGSGRGPFVPALLVAGSFAPDVTYFAASAVPGAMEFGTFTHSFAGVLTADVLIAFALVALWRLVREPVLALLPDRVRGRVWSVARPRPLGRRWPLRWYVSAALGALTHVVWDAFTHLDRWGMRVLPVLGEKIAGSPLYWYAQYGGSAIALAVIGWFVWRSLRGTPAASGPASATSGERWLACALIGGCACGCGAVRVVRWLSYVEESGLAWKPWEIIPTVCFGAGAGLVLGLILYAVVVRVRARRVPPHPAGPTTRRGRGVRERPAEPSRRSVH
ncbi:DUF4184 family protein [Streptomyces sp. NPDC052225]|uniref:DUF4184 family protein n=1 Tax=Streptomyces sp. NPDC052225 TaxID=3154949 RepID=UPI003426AC6A